MPLPIAARCRTALFKNDGKGNFTLDYDAFPRTTMRQIQVWHWPMILTMMDTLICSSAEEACRGEYGAVPSSYVYLNDGKGILQI